ncbi:hypothetical protein Q3G72_034449 [Acer saccharum]|nr:hypothetical protein Q3G72_034449 [Acer saccharum]
MGNELKAPLLQTKGSGVLKACFNATNAFLGIGLLTVPYALSSGGWLSLTLFLSVAAITFYTGILLKRCMDTDPSIKSYLDIADCAFGAKGRITVLINMNSECYLVAVGLLILESDNLHKLFPDFMIKIGTLVIGGRESFVIITGLVILPTMLLTDLSLLSYVSATGVFSCLLTVGSILSVGAFGGVGFHGRGALLNFDGLPTAVSLYIVCFAGHVVIPSVYSSMHDRCQFSKVLLYSFILTAITYMSMATVGYLMYGDIETQITLYLPTSEIGAKIAIYTTLLIPVTRYALTVTPVANTIEGGLSEEYKNWRPVRLLIRIGLLVSTLIIAYLFPYFENLVSIIGSIFVVLASFVLPCLCYMKIFGLYKNFSYKRTVFAGIIVFGVVAGILGTYSSVVDFMRNV